MPCTDQEDSMSAKIVSNTARYLAGGTVLLGAGLCLAACSSTTHSNGSPAVTSTPATVTVTQTVSASTPASTTASSAPASSASSTAVSSSSAGYTVDFSAAKSQWVQGSTASSAQEGEFWLHAASDLDTAVSVGAPSSYSHAAGQLRQLASLPDAMLTPTQQTEFHNDVTALNSFFGTSGLYS
jgi:hypothetical protein